MFLKENLFLSSFTRSASPREIGCADLKERIGREEKKKIIQASVRFGAMAQDGSGDAEEDPAATAADANASSSSSAAAAAATATAGTTVITVNSPSSAEEGNNGGAAGQHLYVKHHKASRTSSNR